MAMALKNYQLTWSLVSPGKPKDNSFVEAGLSSTPLLCNCAAIQSSNRYLKAIEKSISEICCTVKNVDQD